MAVQRPNRQRRVTITLFMAYLLLLAGIVLFKLPFYSGPSDGIRVINLIPLQGSFDGSGALNFREIIDNTIIFIPLGIYTSVLRKEWSLKKKILSAIALTITFEVTQFIFALGRTDITDMLSNTLGAFIGIALYSLLSKIFNTRTVRIVNVLALTLTTVTLLRFAQLFYFSHYVMRPPRG